MEKRINRREFLLGVTAFASAAALKLESKKVSSCSLEKEVDNTSNRVVDTVCKPRLFNNTYLDSVKFQFVMLPIQFFLASVDEIIIPIDVKIKKKYLKRVNDSLNKDPESVYMQICFADPIVSEITYRIIPSAITNLFGYTGTNWEVGFLSSMIYSEKDKGWSISQFASGMFWWWIARNKGYPHVFLAHMIYAHATLAHAIGNNTEKLLVMPHSYNYDNE